MSQGRFLLLFLCLLLPMAAFGGGPVGTFAFRSYGPEQGLRNEAVTSLAQDGAGFLFVGTEDGLYRYDGDQFIRLGAADGLPSDSITVLHASPRGSLWVATQKGLVAWNGDHVDASTPRPLLPNREILGINASIDDHWIVATTSGFFEGNAHTLTPVPGLPRTSGASWIAPDGSRTLFAADKLLYLRDAAGRWRARKLPEAATSELVQSIVEDQRGRIWIRGRQMLLRLDRFDGAFEDLHGALPGEAVQKGELYLDAAGRVWAPSNNGVVCFDGDRQILVDGARGLPNTWATTLLVDREGSLWVGSEGVQQALGRMAWSSITRRQGLPSDTVWTIWRDRDGVLWAGTNRGVAYATANGWTTLPMTSERSFYAFAESPDGDLWIGGNSGHAGSNTLLLRPHGSVAFQPVPLASAKGAATVNSMAFGTDGALYVATIAHGLHRIVRDEKGFASEQVALPGGTLKEQVNQLANAPGGRMWASGNQGLAMFDGHAWHRYGVADGLREKEIETIAPIDADSLWISYWNVTGLTRFRVTTAGARVVAEVTAPDALLADTIYSSGIDAKGTLWLGTALEVKRSRAGTVERYGRADGLPGNDASANAFWADKDGDVWFGMANGLAHFDARFDAPPPQPPAAVITALQDAHGRAVPRSRPEIAWNDRAMTFHVAALAFLSPTRIQRQVRLAGFEDAWRDTTLSEERYAGLLPGRYRFEARARYRNGPFGAVAHRDVVVLPPWWLTWWFLALLAVVVALLILLAQRAWHARLLRRNVQLEALVAERTHALQHAVAALEEVSMIDLLTGLKNRRFLETLIPEEIARCNRERRASLASPESTRTRNVDLCVLMIDLDHFKRVNDEHGHAAGDAVLQQVGQVLRASCRESDVVVRWGGEEFMILARNANRDQVQALAAQVCRSIRNHPFDLGHGLVLRKTCSVGFTAFPLASSEADRSSWERAIELADQCMYVAKQNGRDGWVGCMPHDPAARKPEGADEVHIRKLAGHGDCRVISSFPDTAALLWKE